MTRVDFYLLSQQQPTAQEQFVCRLTEKAFRLGHRIFLHGKDEQQARKLDELLWTFRDRSFIPHGLAADVDAEPDFPVVIGSGEAPRGDYDLLINCADDIPDFFSRFERVVETIPNEDQAKARGRTRYRFYRDRGYPLEMHRL
ncbi:DNA polymerase III subunit chi [Natronospira bacteriovora]|uniref:DNA polymerase III subunit chi n=1 Tax=Natronospira bacteriovora TaxID=3069753 RepID=A0ABU0W5Y3_9GAMM|nr:DNA polymerase III subunit chi [Natronospira sp. AB-CW4]MDQ2069411.1 DNA polymerase III subunit chi [Natronospira sp. AB-CW4]